MSFKLSIRLVILYCLPTIKIMFYLTF